MSDDWANKEITVEPDRLLPRIQVEILGLDEQGRQTYRCPFCHEVGYFAEDGIGHCPHSDALQSFLQAAYQRLAAELDEAALYRPQERP